MKEGKEIEEEEDARIGLSEKNVTTCRETISSKGKDRQTETDRQTDGQADTIKGLWAF